MAYFHYALLAITLIASAGCLGSRAQEQPRGSKNGEIIEDWGVTRYPLSSNTLSRLGLHATSSTDDVRNALLRFDIDISKHGAATIYQGGSSLLVKSFDLQRKQIASLIAKLEKEE